jgi:hypothetical protein
LKPGRRRRWKKMAGKGGENLQGFECGFEKSGNAPRAVSGGGTNVRQLDETKMV